MSRWKAEGVKHGLKPRDIGFAIQQLCYQATLGSAGTHLSQVLQVFQSDHALEPALARALHDAIAPLGRVPDNAKDWHPGSGGLVLDLVHPSLHPLIYGTSHVLPADTAPRGVCAWQQLLGQGQPVAAPSGYGPMLSKQHQWLPAQVHVTGGGEATFQSYINNLHPQQHAPLYAALEQLLGACLPLLQTTLTHALAQDLVHAHIDAAGFPKYKAQPAWPEGSNTDEGSVPVIEAMPEAPERFKAPPPPEPFVLAGRELQVIVKVSDTVLTPDQPEYPGGSWHVEGMDNERIVATIIAYLECDNISMSRLSFRQSIDDEGIYYEQNDDDGCRAVYGIGDEEFLCQTMGALECRAGRVVCFPNTMQHRVEPFQLTDATQPGRRRIIALFVVDPLHPVLSTQRVLPQQAAWWQAAGVDAAAARRHGSPVPLTWAEAEQHRLALMEERSALQEEADGWHFERPFSLCEH